MLSINLEDHDAVQDIVCFDSVPALLSLLQDDNLMLPENLVVNLDDPTSMYLPSDNKNLARPIQVNVTAICSGN